MVKDLTSSAFDRAVADVAMQEDALCRPQHRPKRLLKGLVMLRGKRGYGTNNNVISHEGIDTRRENLAEIATEVGVVEGKACTQLMYRGAMYVTSSRFMR